MEQMKIEFLCGAILDHNIDRLFHLTQKNTFGDIMDYASGIHFAKVLSCTCIWSRHAKG